MSHILAAQCASELNHIHDTVTLKIKLENAIREINFKYGVKPVNDHELLLGDGSNIVLIESTAKWEVKIHQNS